MQIPLQTIGDGIELSREQEEMIRAEVDALERFYDRLTGCRVMVRVPNRFPAGVPMAHTIRLNLDVPGGQIAVTRQAKPSFREALKDAFAAARRRLQDHARKQREVPKEPAKALAGTIGRVFPYEGYGFIATADGGELYFHRNSVLDDGFDRLTPGAKVRFTEEIGTEGPQASTVALHRRPARAVPRSRSGKAAG